MEQALADRLGSWLERPEIRALDPAAVAALGAALGQADPPATPGRGGSLVGYVPGPGRRRLVQFDRRGHLVAACRWAPDGRLAWARCVTVAGEWVGIEPAAARHPVLGDCDRLWRIDPVEPWAPREAITVFQALDYERLDWIPPLLEPARLPPGAGTAVLNLIASLMKDQGASRVRYRGPYPTEQLFTALLESFRYDDATSDPLGRFMDAGALDWLPAPHEVHRVADGVSIQVRLGIDKVVMDGVAFYRRDWQDVVRREPRIVREDGERVVCSLWAFGRAIDDRLVLDRAGEVIDRRDPDCDQAPPAPLPPVWNPSLAEIIGRESAPALAAPIRDVLRQVTLEWGAVPGDLMRAKGTSIRVSRRLREVGTAWVREAASGPERGERAVAFVLEVARLLAPAIRQKAQALLLEATPAEQERALTAPPAPPEELPESVGRLLALVARGAA